MSALIQKKCNYRIDAFSEKPLSINFSDYLDQTLQHDYTCLANLFPEVKGTTIEHFTIAHKIKREKELLVYN
jgi:hypothetical protein